MEQKVLSNGVEVPAQIMLRHLPSAEAGMDTDMWRPDYKYIKIETRFYRQK